MDSHDSLARKKSSMRRTPTNASQGSESLQRKRNSIQFEEPPKEGEDDEPIPVIRYRNSIVRNYDGQINNSKKSTIHNDEPSGFGFDLEKAISLENFDVTNSIKDKLANSLSTPVKPLNFALLGVQRNLSSPLLSPTYEFKMTHEKNVDEGDDSNSDEKSSDEDDNVRKTEPLKGSESKKASFNELPKIQASAFDNESPPSASPTRQGTMTLGRSLSKSIKKVMSKSSLASSHASSVTVIARLQELIWQKYLDFLDLPLILRAIDFLESCQIKVFILLHRFFYGLW